MRQDQTKQWRTKKLTVTPRARSLWKKEQAAAGGYEVVRSTSTIWFASKQGYARYRRIDIETLSALVQLLCK